MNTTTMFFDAFPRSAPLFEPMDAGFETPTVSWFIRLRQVLANWAQQAALSHAESPLWDIAQSDPRVMAELMLARKAEDRVEAPQVEAMSDIPEADTVAAVVPARAPLLGQGWARVIEDAYQVRTRNALWRYA